MDGLSGGGGYSSVSPRDQCCPPPLASPHQSRHRQAGAFTDFNLVVFLEGEKNKGIIHPHVSDLGVQRPPQPPPTAHLPAPVVFGGAGACCSPEMDGRTTPPPQKPRTSAPALNNLQGRHLEGEPHGRGVGDTPGRLGTGHPILGRGHRQREKGTPSHSLHIYNIHL